MKNLIIIVSFFMFAGIYAQEKTPVDKMESTKTTTTTIDKNGEKVIVSKVKETTRKEQEIKTEQREGQTVNGDKIDTPIKVTKSIQIDRDWDPFYDTIDKTVYYNLNGEKMTFNSNDSGFLMSSSENNLYGEARKSTNNHFYLTTTRGYPGVGYFDSNGSFIVEYYDKQISVVVMEIYEATSF